MIINKKYKIIILFSILISLVSLPVLLKLIRRPKQLNVILITLDSLRPDHLGCYGYKRNTSPNIDNLAREGVLFTQAISTATLTIPSLTSLMSSTYLSTNGVFDNLMAPNYSLPTLQQILRDKGYYTGFISGHGALEDTLRMGFNTYEDYYCVKADRLTAKAIKWIKMNKEKPFFLWLHYIDPHSHYRPPEPYKTEYLNDKVYRLNKKIPISSSVLNSVDNEIPLYVAEKGINDIDYYIAQYDGAISFADEQIGYLLKQVKGLGLAKHTLIVITADHGESLGEHNLYFKHGNIYDAVLKVPLIFKCYGIIPARKIIRQQVSSIDITPTILSILKIKCDQRMEGMSLFLGGGKWRNRPVAFSEFKPDPEEIVTSVRTSQWKLIHGYKKHKYHLYNLEQDPQEFKDLVEINIGMLKFLTIKLEEWMNRKKSIQPVTVNRMDEETKNRLKSFGYVQ